MAEAQSGEGDVGITNEQILQVGAVLLKEFIFERVRRHGDSGGDAGGDSGGDGNILRNELGGSGLCDPSHKKLAQCLQQIGDELDNNADLQRMLADSSIQPTREIFVKVAREIFSDGKFNWGRVVALFYFACRLALLKKIPEIIQTIVTWTMDYLQEHVITWIQEQGGWEGIRSYFGTPTWQTIGVFLAGVLTTVLVMRKM
ncbi:BCL2 associated X, apoptosis regulator a [Silurus meridionalis]|nr:BCL2 associated X, apoptosis regulator a [Silurus meridionalis]